MERPERPVWSFVRQVGGLLLLLNLVVAAYALLIGWKAAGPRAALGLFLWGSALVSTGIGTLAVINLLYVAVSELIRRRRGKRP
jgi:hypothetical protein